MEWSTRLSFLEILVLLTGFQLGLIAYRAGEHAWTIAKCLQAGMSLNQAVNFQEGWFAGIDWEVDFVWQNDYAKFRMTYYPES